MKKLSPTANQTNGGNKEVDDLAELQKTFETH